MTGRPSGRGESEPTPSPVRPLPPSRHTKGGNFHDCKVNEGGVRSVTEEEAMAKKAEELQRQLSELQAASQDYNKTNAIEEDGVFENKEKDKVVEHRPQ